MLSRRLVAAALALVSLTACQVGERPYFSEDPFPAGLSTGDPNVDAVLDKLDALGTGPFTAAYAVLRKYGNLEFTALVAVSAGARAVTLGNTRYLQTEPIVQTCKVDRSTPCLNGLVAQSSSDTGLTVDFYSADAAKPLRRDTGAKEAPTTLYYETFAEQPATCVDVPLPNGTATYCALANALLAELDDGVLEVVVVEGRSKVGMVLGSSRFYRGSHIGARDITHFSCEKIRVELDNPHIRDRFLLDVDGEPLGKLPVEAWVDKRALRVRS